MRVLVTGGGGFLGTRICRMLQARGEGVVALGRNPYAHLAQAGIRTVQADIRDPDAVRRACKGVDLVIHSAAMPGIWGSRRLFWDTNVGGTRNVILGCKTCGVARLIYTSSPSVVFGNRALAGVDESQPYPSRYLAHYPASKAAAEQMVLQANGPAFATVALRPHLIFGPGDPHLFPRIVARAKAGRLVQVGDGTNRVDVTYVANAAEAHIRAAEALAVGAPCAGRAYFISQGEPVVLWPWLNEILAALGLRAVRRRVSHRTARAVGHCLEALYRVVGFRAEPPMTRFLAGQLAKPHYFCIDAARRDLGYRPRVSTDEGVRQLVAWLKDAK